MNLQQLGRWFHTVRHLRPVQISNRIARKIRRPRWDQLTSGDPRPATGRWTLPARRPPLMSGPDALRVFERIHPLSAVEHWQSPLLEHLVRYNLHYFDDLNTADAESRRAWHERLLARWVAENPPGSGTGWEPYPLSIRIVNWIKWSLGGRSLDATLRDSLATQGQALFEQIEFHLLANHLFANAKALTFLGAYFQDSFATPWLEMGLRLLERELAEQILPDGGHFELSPMYHALILEDLLDLWNLLETFPALNSLNELRPRLSAQLAAMRRWLQIMTHPDGQISFFNDAAWGVAAEPGELEQYADRLRLPGIAPLKDGVFSLRDSGYVRLQLGESVVLLDVAEVGPTYQPGHAHADTLSWEWSWRGDRVAVNSGTSCYGVSAERHRQRSTAAHNTVVVNETNSSDVWSGFRVGRRARPGRVELQERDGVYEVRASHDGYASRRPGVIHQRRWRLSPGEWVISDQLDGLFRQASQRCHLHPAVITQPVAGTSRSVVLSIAGQTVRCETHPSPVRVESGTFHPRFEVAQANSCLVAEFQGPRQEMRFAW